MVLFDLYAPWICRSCCAMISMHVINQCILMLLHAGRVTTSCHGNSVFLLLVREVLMDAPVNWHHQHGYHDYGNSRCSVVFFPQLLCHSYVMETKKPTEPCMWLTFDYLLGTGAVDLLLRAVSWEDSVKHIRLPLWRPTQTQSAMTKTV